MESAIEQFISGTKKHDKNVPLEYQLPLLGVEENIKDLMGKRLLDIGCGKGDLVNYLRSKGIKAEGIDPRAPKKHGFKRKLITGPGKNLGIPETDNSYDIITIFQNPPLNTYFTTNPDYVEVLRQVASENPAWWHNICEQAIGILLEIRRVLKLGGRAIIYPGLSTLEERTGGLLEVSGLNNYNEAVPTENAFRYNNWEFGFPDKDVDSRLDPIEYDQHAFMRTIIIKERNFFT